MVADIEELEEMDASELHARRPNAKEVSTPHIPCSRWNSKNLWETLARERPDRGEEQEILQGKSDESDSPTQLQDDSTRDDEEAKDDFWTIFGEIIYRHHAVPRVKLYLPREETFPIPMMYIDVTRTTHTSLDVMLEKQIEDNWNVDGEKELSDAWTGFTIFVLLKERPREGFSCSGERLTRK